MAPQPCGAKSAAAHDLRGCCAASLHRTPYAAPMLPGIDAAKTPDSVSVKDLDEVPDHMVVVGGSYFGLEFAHLMRRLGAESLSLLQGGRLHRCRCSDLPRSAEASRSDAESMFYRTLHKQRSPPGLNPAPPVAGRRRASSNQRRKVELMTESKSVFTWIAARAAA